MLFRSSLMVISPLVSECQESERERVDVVSWRLSCMDSVAARLMVGWEVRVLLCSVSLLASSWIPDVKMFNNVNVFAVAYLVMVLVD